MSNKVTPAGGFQPLRMQNGTGMQVGSVVYAFAGSARSGGPIIGGGFGRILIKTGSVDASGRTLVRNAVAADTDNGSPASLVGVSAIVMSSTGDYLNIQYADLNTAGTVLVWADPNIVYLAMMSGVPTAYGGSFALVPGTVSNYDPNTADQPYPSPIVTDKVDSTTYNASSVYHALTCLGAYGTPLNRDATAAMPAEIMIGSTFMSV